SGGGMLAVARWSLGAHRLSTSLGARTERSHIRDEGLSVAERGGLRRRLVTASARDSLPLGSARVTLLAEWELRRDDFAGAGNGRVPPPADDSRDAALGGSASLALPLGEGWTLRGSAGSFHRRPSLAELFGDSGQVRGNPSLDPEHGWKFEAGPSAAFRAGAWTWSAELAAFASRTDDMILVWPQSQGVSVAENVGSARVAGVEASASLRAPGGFAVDAAGTLQRARAAGGPYDGKRLPTVPERLGWIGTSWNPGRWSLGWELRYVGENSSDRLDEERYRLPARVLHDVRAARDVGAGIRLSVEVQNLFDRETRDVARFPLPGRLVYGGARWSYGGGR
ncbi:MAG: TonB-dependent receptor, partial [Acidobacteria bacterium]|nr:TonB-dependent receptor [Acidobacteriota bacterium]